MNKLQHKLLPLILVLLVVLGCNQASCERNTTVVIRESKNPPTFALSGNGHLNFFWVSEVDAPQPIPEDVRTANGKDRILWEIWPAGHQRKIVDDLPTITYGQVPAGFIQKIPTQGAPSPLKEGKTYEAGGPSSGANMNVFRFTITEGSVVELPLPANRYRN